MQGCSEAAWTSVIIPHMDPGSSSFINSGVSKASHLECRAAATRAVDMSPVGALIIAQGQLNCTQVLSCWLAKWRESHLEPWLIEHVRVPFAGPTALRGMCLLGVS